MKHYRRAKSRLEKPKPKPRLLEKVLQGDIEEKIVSLSILTLGLLFILYPLCIYGYKIQLLPIIVVGVVFVYFAFYMVATIQKVNNIKQHGKQK